MTEMTLLEGVFTTGAGITTIVGLIGFLIACVFVYLVYQTRQETERLRSLPEKERSREIDNLTRYDLTVKNLPDEEKYKLVVQEMSHRFRWRVTALSIGAFVFLACVVILALPQSNGSKLNPASQDVLKYKHAVSVLRGTFEARNDIADASKRIKEKGVRLAESLSNIRDSEIDESRRIIKYEYMGWALSMVARVYEDDVGKAKRIKYTEQAIKSFRNAIELMDRVKQKHAQGDPLASKIYNYFITGESEDYNRTRYLLAKTLAVNAQAGGRFAKQHVTKELSVVSDSYLENYPLDKDEYFQWALSR